MSERKVLNKYYPPDFDPSKIPKLREPKNKTFSIRIMAPFNMRCNVCGEYIYKGKKFNSRKENVDDEDFLGLRIFRFYIRCPKCVAEIAFKTDLKNTDYTLEAGATRLFEAEKLAQQMAEQERLEKEAEELNPMTVLENRTKASHKEMAQIDELEELREISARHAKVDTQVLLEKQRLYEEHLLRLQQEEEDQMIQSIFGSKQGQVVKRLADADSDEEEDGQRQKYRKLTPSADQSSADLLTDNTEGVQSSKQEPKKMESWKKSVGSLSSKNILSSLVRKKPFSSTSVVSDGTKAAAEQQSRVHDTVKISSDELIRSTQETKSVENQSNQTSSQQPVKLPITEKGKPQTSSSSSALGLLGGYSGSETDSDNSG